MTSPLKLENEQRYLPLQPEIICTMDNYMEYKPQYPFNEHIAYYYQFDTSKNVSDSLSLIPDGCFDMVFCCCGKNHTSFLRVSVAKRSKEVELNHPCTYFGVKFLPEQNMIKFNRPMKELVGRQIPLIDIVPIVSNTIEKIAAASNFHERVKIIEKHLHKQTKKLEKEATIEYCIDQIYSSKGTKAIKEIVEGTGYSDRYVRNLFEERVGFRPKEFSEIVRFQHSVSMIIEEDKYSMVDIAYENGYHDQAHFIRSFKRYALMSPNQCKRFLFD